MASATPATASVPAPPAPGAFCRACGRGIDQRAVICPQCGVATGHGQQAGTVVVSGAKSGGVAVILSLLITGAGHWYTGEVGRGFAFFGGAILAAFSLAFLIGIVALPAVWIWAAIDANKSAERHNRRVASAAAQPLALAR
jgi:TM2 domain-containing membrane protein YozV